MGKKKNKTDGILVKIFKQTGEGDKIISEKIEEKVFTPEEYLEVDELLKESMDMLNKDFKILEKKFKKIEHIEKKAKKR